MICAAPSPLISYLFRYSRLRNFFQRSPPPLVIISPSSMSESILSGVLVRSNSPPVESDEVILNLDGNTTFITTKRTLVEGSTYFASRLSDRWPSVDRELKLDMDPAVFIHVLRYLRHGVLPIFYDRIRGFDHGLYCLVLAQADYLLIERLSSWIREKRYLLAVRNERSAKIFLDDVKDINGSDSANVNCQYQIIWGKKKVYSCPRGISVHEWPSQCGRQCNNARGDSPLYHDVDELRIFEFKTKTVFDSHVGV